MNRRFPFGAGLAAWMLAVTSALAQSSLQQPQLVAPATQDDSYTRQLAEISPSDKPANYVSTQVNDLTPTTFDDAPANAPAATPSCGCSQEPACGCEEPSCGCDGGCSSCGCGNDSCLFGDCCLGDAWTLESCIDPCGCCDHTIGGWIGMGYYSDNERLSADPGDGFAFLDFPDHLNLDQAWLYAEKVAEGGACSAGWGYRADVLYGVDAQKTQAFGNNSGSWDNSFDNGVYGWAIPQAYGQVAFGDWSVKLGHFFTLVGYEVVADTGNFFYSHSYTMFNSQPFTHTGVLGAYSLDDDTTVHMGWVLGWDTGFDQFDGGNAFHGGVIHQATDNVNVSFMCTAGNFGFRSAGESGYEQAVVVTSTLSEQWDYVLETDYVHSNGFLDDPGFHATDVSIVNYLFYTLSDCWKAGGRMEWWKSNTVTGESTSFYELTGGVNYKPHANVVIRPEIRYNWSPTELFSTTTGAEFNNTVFAIDGVFTF
jgi:hypothetical protein